MWLNAILCIAITDLFSHLRIKSISIFRPVSSLKLVWFNFRMVSYDVGKLHFLVTSLPHSSRAFLQHQTKVYLLIKIITRHLFSTKSCPENIKFNLSFFTSVLSSENMNTCVNAEQCSSNLRIWFLYFEALPSFTCYPNVPHIIHGTLRGLLLRSDAQRLLRQTVNIKGSDSTGEGDLEDERGEMFWISRLSLVLWCEKETWFDWSFEDAPNPLSSTVILFTLHVEQNMYLPSDHGVAHLSVSICCLFEDAIHLHRKTVAPPF